MSTPDLPTFRSADTAARFGLDGYDETTYGESFADVYDDWYDDLADDDFVAVVAASLPAESARVLELGVGTGRLLQKLRRLRPDSGDEHWGIDSSESMMKRARARLGEAASLVTGDFSRTLPTGPFDAVFVGYNTLFNLPDGESLASCMGLVADRLAPGGSFVVDATLPIDDDASSTNDHVGIRTMRTGEVVLTVSRHDPAERRIIGQFVSYVDGERVRLRPWVVRYWPPEELDHVADTVGLTLVTRTADGAGTPYASGGNRHISLYRRLTGNLGDQ